ncbi:MAG: 30S ribosomal protein S1 [Deltaproteobacteria bacterium]|jgi:small subunit ribosomal protein S1|nr:30S ribosomal protein S1 [Deltaproteobacteria bacterium]MBT4526544.1 30S ribosomal protein S1 [Deltaproteobacteria bacterium]
MTELTTIETFEGKIDFIDEEFDFDQQVSERLEKINEGEIVTGNVTQISKDFVTIDFGYKSEGQVSRQEFMNEEHELTVQLLDNVDIYLERFEDEHGQVVVSKEKADKLRVWEEVGRVHEEDGIVSGVITARIKGGLSVDIGIKAFLPGSQVDLRPIRNLDKLLGERFDFKVLKYNPKRGNIVLSRRAILEIAREEQREKTLEMLQEGAVITGAVKNITDYGIFVDLGGVDGLLHITDMTWGRIVHPSEMYAIGDEIDVMVLKFDEADEKVSLGLKQKTANPWDSVQEKYPIGTEVQGKVVSLTNYGAFIEIEEGVEGLIHVSEMSWTKKVRQPSTVVAMGDLITAVIKELDVEQRRISLSMKESMPNPWREVAERNPAGAIVHGKIRNITDFGIFVGLDEGIDGLVHVSDMSWSQRQRNPNELYKKGDEIDVKILNIDIDNQRLSLGIKQLTEDPWQTLDDEIKENEVVTGKIVHIADFGVFLEIKPGVEGLIHVSEIDKEVSKKNLTIFYPIGSNIQAKIINLKVSERRLGLSVIGLVEANAKALNIDLDALREEDAEGATEVVEETVTEKVVETAPVEETPDSEETTEKKPVISLEPEETE